MINYEEARRLVLQYLAGIDGKERKTAETRKDLTARERELLGLGREDAAPGTALVENATIEGEFGWVFFYQSKKYIESGDFMDQEDERRMDYMRGLFAEIYDDPKIAEAKAWLLSSLYVGETTIAAPVKKQNREELLWACLESLLES